MRQKNTIKKGECVRIRCKTSWANGEWGIVKCYDGEFYHVAIWNGDECLVFLRRELRRVNLN